MPKIHLVQQDLSLEASYCDCSLSWKRRIASCIVIYDAQKFLLLVERNASSKEANDKKNSNPFTHKIFKQNTPTENQFQPLALPLNN